MTEFEIRVLRPEGTPAIVSTANLFSTQAAVGSAVRMARGRPFEIWTEGRCVYGGPTPSPSPTDHPAA